MFQNLFQTFVKKALYGVIGNLGAMLSFGVENYQFVGNDPLANGVWTSVVVGGITGIAAAIKRFATWDERKA